MLNFFHDQAYACEIFREEHQALGLSTVSLQVYVWFKILRKLFQRRNWELCVIDSG